MVTLLWSSGIRADTIDDMLKKREQIQQGQSVTGPTNFSPASQMSGANYQVITDDTGNMYLVANNNQGQVFGSVEFLPDNNVQITIFDNSNPEQKVSFTTVVSQDDLKNANYEEVLRSLTKQLNESKLNGQKYDENVQQAAINLLSWRQDFLSADDETKNKMCEQVGVTREQAESFSKETQQKVLVYLMTKDGKNLPEGNVTVEGLKDFAEKVTLLVDSFRVAVTQMFANLVKVFQQKESGQPVQISISEIQNIAQQQGVDLTAIGLDVEQLESALQHSPAIVHLIGENGQGEFIVVTGIKDGQVSYIGSDGKTVSTMSLDEFKQKWSGKSLVLSLVGEQVGGGVLDPKTSQETKGTFISRLFNLITNIFGNDKPATVQAKLDVIFDPKTDIATLEKLAQDKNKWVSLAASRVLGLMSAGLDKESAAKVAKLMFVSEHSRKGENRTIATEQLIQY